MSDETITDIWFRSPLKLHDIAARLGLDNVTEDAEDYWEWTIGALSGAQLDITRTHTIPAGKTDTRVFLLHNQHFTDELLTEIVTRLAKFVSGSIKAGRWEHRSGQDFNLIVVRSFGP